MDILAHAIYGATACSRTGIAGGAKGAGRRWIFDRTVWWATAFGVFPDLVSMGAPFLLFLASGAPGNFFREMDGNNIVLYRYMHSLLVAFAGIGILWFVRRSLFIPALAWPLHILCDALTHGTGKFQTTIFYPLSDWGYDGIRWWQHPGAILGYWLLLPLTWLVLRIWRQRQAGKADPSAP